jgi:hypothetical protein
MDFSSFEEMAQFFLAAEHNMGAAIIRELEHQGPPIAAEVKRYFGTYGPGWAELAPATQAERVRQGYAPDDPLFRSGELQGLIAPEVHGESLFVGIPEGAQLADGADANEVMSALNDGTSDGRIPPRDVFGQAVANLDRFAHAFGRGVAIRLKL